MANKNPNTSGLLKMADLTPLERRNRAKKAAKKSVEVRRERKKFNELFNSYLDKKVTDIQLKMEMLQFGFADDECTNKNAVVLAQYKEALSGNTQSAIFIRDTIGEKPRENVDISGNINNPFTGLTTEELRKIVNSE